ncbi:helix-turn-helix transcriptional regulator [Euzebya rosea]|uniref:helix-turn-helix transcriptional regulator n=1 Tax=Euzebya rosea TaxID=2052804 RepID=UPI000D3E2049|nr:LuxR C-terminal-related transcriptional regulator [Euzebya rosea]
MQGRERELGLALDLLADGRSVLLVGRPGVGTTTVARAVIDAVDSETALVTGSPRLVDHPLAAAGIGGLVAPSTSSDPAARVAIALRGLESRAEAGPLVVMVEGWPQLDPWTARLLVDGVRAGVVALVASATLDTRLDELGRLLADDSLVRVHIPPLDDEGLATLAPSGTDPALVQRALDAADGAPLWFLHALRTGWFGDDAPMPPVLREIIDGQIGALAPGMEEVLQAVAVAGVVAPVALTRIGDEGAVRRAVEGELLTDVEGLLRVRDRFLQHRLLERASLNRAALLARLRDAAEHTGTPLPLLPASEVDDRAVPDADALASLAEQLPRDVLEALAPLPRPLDDDLALVAARATLAMGEAETAVAELTRLGADGVAPEVATDAAMLLAMLHAHVLGDVRAARGCIDRALSHVTDRDLVRRLRARVVTLIGYGHDLDAVEVPDSDEADSPRTALEVGKAQGVAVMVQRGWLPHETADRLEHLLSAAGAAASERWETLAAVHWSTFFVDGPDATMALDEREMAIAARSRDAATTAAWWSLAAGMLVAAGHPVTGGSLARRAAAALRPVDRYDLRAFCLAYAALAAVHTGDAAAAPGLLAEARAAAAPTNALARSTIDVVALEVAGAHRRLEQDAFGAGLERYDRLGRPQVVWMLAACGVHGDGGGDVDRSLPAPSTSGAADRWPGLVEAIRAGHPAEALRAAREMAAAGMVGPAAAALRGRRRGDLSDRLDAQHVGVTLDGVALPGLPHLPGPASPRQLEMGRLAARGASDQQIADRMTLSRRTVSNTLSRLYRALDLDGRPSLTTLLTPVEMWQPALPTDGSSTGPSYGTTLGRDDI